MVVRIGEKILTEGYVSPKDFLKAIPSVDLSLLLALSLSGRPEARYAYIFGMLFATSNGEVMLDTKNVDNKVMQAWEYMTMEEMSRKDPHLIIHYDRMVFSDEREKYWEVVPKNPPAET